MFHCAAAVSLRISTKPRNQEIDMKDTQIIIRLSLRAVLKQIEIKLENNNYKVSYKLPFKQDSQEYSFQTQENNQRAQI